MLGTPEQTAAGAEPLDGPALTWARGDRARARDRPRRRLDRRARRGPRARLEHVRARRAGRRATTRSTARSTCSTSRSAGGPTASPSTRTPGDEVVVSETAGGVGLGPDRLLRPPLPRALPRSWPSRGARVLTVPPPSRSPTTRDHWEVLLRARAIEDQASSSPPTRSAGTRRAYRSGGRSMIVDPWGVVLAQAPDARGVRRWPSSTSSARPRCARTLPSLANRRPEAYRWPEEVPPRGAQRRRRRQAPR